MRRVIGIAVIVMSLIIVLAACGKKDAGAVVKDLESKMDKLESYSTSGTMVLNTGLQPQEYQVEVWFQKKSYYRIALTNEKKDISQIVLRNDDGVFVLTPHLNKSFRFQSEWPENQGQVYLYQSLIESIVTDNDRRFTTDGDSYVFDVAANYQNASLVRQKVWVNQKTYAPQHVEISDANNNVLVVMNFNNFEFDKKFDKDSFDMQRNMSGAIQSLPTMDHEEGTTTTEAGKEEGKQGQAQGQSQAQAQGQPAADQQLALIEPSYMPEGVEQAGISQTKIGDNKAIILKYTGDYSYTIIETRPNDQPVAFMEGTVVDLGYTIGVLTGAEKKTLIWMYDGMEFRLSSGDLPLDEMVNIAMAVQDVSAK